MQKIFELLKNKIHYLIIVYVIVQLIYVLFFPIKFQSDSYYYYRLAEQCISSHSFYPAPRQLYEDYISAPLYINLLIIVLTIYNSTVTLGLLNIILNMLQLFLVYSISKKLMNKEIAIKTAAIYVFYLGTLGLVLLNFTELFFNVLVLSSIYFYLKKTNLSYIFAGILAGASIGVRPLGWALLISYILISIYQVIKMKSSFSKNLIILIGFILFILTFGFYTKSYFGKFIYTSTNGPANFLIGANNNATGGFNSTVFEPGKIGYIQNEESETYIEKGKFYEHKAINWIEHHPVKWIALIPVKLGYIFLWDDYSVSQLMHMQDWNLYVILKHIITTKSLRGLLGNASIAVKVTFFSLLIIHHLYYFLLLFLMIMGIRIMIKNDKLNIDLLLLILVALLILSMTVLVFGAARFKYPIMILLLPFAGFKLSTIKEVKYFNFYK